MQRDMRNLDFPPQSFDAILFWGSIVHVNIDDCRSVLRRAYVRI